MQRSVRQHFVMGMDAALFSIQAILFKVARRQLIKVKLHAFAMMDGVARNVMSSDEALLLNCDYSLLGLPGQVYGTGVVYASQANYLSHVVWYIG